MMKIDFLCNLFSKGILLAATVVLISCSGKKDDEDVALSNEELVKRGQYLAMTSACHDCHSPKIMTPHGPVPDPDRLLSGHPSDEPLLPIVKTDWVMFSPGFTAAVGEWGVSFSANLTPHETGTGNWSFEQFKTAIRKGKYKGLEGSRDLLPPMPWDVYRNMTDQDLQALFAYLQSLKPVNNLVPAPIAPQDVVYN